MSIRFIITTIAIFLTTSDHVLRAQNAQITGTSTITISSGTVYAYGTTELDYTSAVYYDVGASVALFKGSSLSSMAFVGQDNENAERSTVRGQVQVASENNLIYEVDTAHYATLVYQESGGGRDGGDGEFVDEYGFSLIDTSSQPTIDTGSPNNVNYFAPGETVLTEQTEIDFPDTVAYQDTSVSCPTSVTVFGKKPWYLPDGNFRTGVGAGFTMAVSGPSTSYDGTKITEKLADTTTSCPGIIKFCSNNDVFTIGANTITVDGQFTASSSTNQFVGIHITTNGSSLLQFLNSSGCTASFQQSYSCGGNQIGSFTIQRVFSPTQVTIGGQTQSATAVGVGKSSSN